MWLGWLLGPPTSASDKHLVRPILYNYPGGAGGEGYAARRHGLAHTIDKLGKVKLTDDGPNIPKKLIIDSDHFYDDLLNLSGSDVYLTHHLNLLDDAQLETLAAKYDIINITDDGCENETFLLKTFKDYAKIKRGEVSLVLGGKVRRKNIAMGSVISELHDLTDLVLPSGICDRILFMLKQFAERCGPFFDDHRAWHQRTYPGEYIRYKAKDKLGTHYLFGRYWDFDQLLRDMR